MKKLGIINSDITKVLTDLGHTDQICIADAGLPVPVGTKKIDLALSKGFPSFLDVLRLVLADMWIEKVYIASEIKVNNPTIYEEIKKMVPETMIEWCTHTEFKALSKNSKAIIRTGEMTPYANIILQSNVHFTEDAE
ncbi:MAG: D-ribose pyranase [Erysipelotrichaceae bacterium]